MAQRKLKITYDDQEKEISIEGNESGLKYLAEICLRVIGKTNPAGHFHLMEEMNNIDQGSVKTVVAFTDG